MSDRASQIEGPAKWAAVAVLGGVGLLGVGRSLFVETVHAPPAAAVPEPVRVEQAPPEARPATASGWTDDAAVLPDATASAEQAAQAVPVRLSASDSIAARIAVNTATAEELDLLPGIGPVYAQRIVEERAANGHFTSTDDLQRVRGIGPKTAAKLGPLVTFDSP
ncbi:MAG: ComEA family DNA-binding protein [Planctomycetota bacterium]